MIKLMKAKTYGKDAKQFAEHLNYYMSTKYDGNCIKIVQNGDNTRWFTSNDKEFTLPLSLPSGDYTLVCEFMYGCEGKLGDRGKSAILTTFRTNFAKGVTNVLDIDKVNIKVFDLVKSDGKPHPYTGRLRSMQVIESQLPKQIQLVKSVICTGREALEEAQILANKGWEGVMLVANHSGIDKTYQPGKRVHHLIKVKFRKTADLLCIDVLEGEGKCEGIGALVLQDSQGRIVKVGSGLDYSEGTRQSDSFIGKVIEIEYEQILETYIQPVFKAIRDDKDVGDID